MDHPLHPDECNSPLLSREPNSVTVQIKPVGEAGERLRPRRTQSFLHPSSGSKPRGTVSTPMTVRSTHLALSTSLTQGTHPSEQCFLSTGEDFQARFNYPWDVLVCAISMINTVMFFRPALFSILTFKCRHWAIPLTSIRWIISRLNSARQLYTS